MGLVGKELKVYIVCVCHNDNFPVHTDNIILNLSNYTQPSCFLYLSELFSNVCVFFFR